MHASDQELENLKRLQHIDAEVIRNKKKLDELPQRQTILETRQKLSAIIKKKTQVQDMIDAFEDELHALLSEDERLEKKQQETQEALDRVKGDYRSVEFIHERFAWGGQAPREAHAGYGARRRRARAHSSAHGPDHGGVR